MNTKNIKNSKLMNEGINSNIHKTPWKTILLYIIIGFSWILFSDKFVSIISDNHEKYMLLQSYKGIFYVLVTAVMLFFMIKLDYSKIMNLNRKVTEKNQELESFSEELISMDEELKEKILNLNQAMKSITLQKKFVDDIFQNSNTCILIWDLDGTVIDINAYFTHVFLYDKEDIVGKKWFDVLFSDYKPEIFDKIKNNLIINKSVQNSENKIIAKDGRVFYMLWNNALIYNPNKDKDLVVSFGIDLTAQKINERKIQELAFNDRLTNFKNLFSFENDILKLIKNKTEFIIYYLDMDNFKHLNEIHGHKCGDIFLTDYSKRLLEIFKIEMLYRWCGDEFVILSLDTDEIQISKKVDEIALITKEKWKFNNIEYYPSVSIGITKYPQDAKNLEELKKTMDMALYQAKSNGKSIAIAYHENFQKDIQSKLDMENLITNSLTNDNFRLVFQPIYDLKTNKIASLEALLRCNENVNIGKLIGIAEDSGQILQIDRWVVKNVFKLTKQYFDDKDIRVCVNLSAKSLSSRDMVDFLKKELANNNLSPNKIEIELTEHSLIHDIDWSMEVITRLKSIGFEIALDDFGTRYSSLNYLSSIPFDYLKIDKSYVDKIITANKSRLIIDQIIQLSHKLGLNIVAEGIELQEQLDELKLLNCDYGQGYLLSRPIEILEVLTKV